MSESGSSLPYHATFPTGTTVRVAARDVLDRVRAAWRFHNPLTQEQLAWADHEAVVQEVGFYHGGDVLYHLDGVPGAWHECCLVGINARAT